MPAGKVIKYIGVTALFLIVFSLSGVVGVRAESRNDGELLIERLDNTLISVMKDAKKLGYSGRYEHLKPVIEETYDFRLIARYSVGRIWKTFSEDQRATLVKRFRALSISTYAARFDGYSGEKIRVTSSKPLRRGRLLVRTELVKADGDIIHLDYVLTKKDDQWRAINVIANGVSDLSLKRAQYTYILKKKSFDNLIKTLDKKIAAYNEE